MSAPLKQSNVIFLFGAGASRPAGIPIIDEMTRSFKELILPNLNRKYKDSEIIRDFKILESTAQAHYHKSDLEFVMSIIHEFDDPKNRILFEKTYPKLKKVFPFNLDKIRIEINDYIRNRCEQIDTFSIRYLWPIIGFVNSSERLKVFTLNYDGALEAFFEKQGISFSDGFDPYWNPKSFEHVNINIMKLHGSLYWLKTEHGTIIKVPLKGLKVSQVKYLTDESVSEMMIYPALKKNKQLGVYSWLSQHFIDSLNNSLYCIAIGYSFRDKEILDNIIEALKSNISLWLVIISPNASTKKEMFLTSPGYDDFDTLSRIVCLDMTTEKALSDRYLSETFDILTEARDREAKCWRDQALSRERLDRDWSNVLNKYLSINHHDRARWIVENLADIQFASTGRYHADVVEYNIGLKAAHYLLDSFSKGYGNRELWGRLFIEYCIVCEYSWLHDASIDQIIMKKELPNWFSWGMNFNSQKFKEEMESFIPLIQKSFVADDLFFYIKKIICTIDILTTGTTSSGALLSSEEILTLYKDEDLGLKKWAEKIVDHANENFDL